MSKDRPPRYLATIKKPRQEVYDAWRDIERQAEYSRHLISVEDLGAGRSRWTAEGPNGDVTWIAEITDDEPGQRISWKSVGESDIDNNGTITFCEAPGDRGTEVTVEMRYKAPGGFFGTWVASLTGNEPEQAMGETLRRFKALLECGEIPVVEGQPSEQMRGSSKPGDMGQTHVHRHIPKLLPRIESGEIDPSFMLTHEVPIDRAPDMYDIFKHKKDDCIKVVLKPYMA